MSYKNQGRRRPHEVLWSLDMSSNPFSSMSSNMTYLKGTGPNGKDCLRVVADNNGYTWAHATAALRANLAQLRGQYIRLHFTVQGDSLNTFYPLIRLESTSVEFGGDNTIVPHTSILTGTFNWRDLSSTYWINTDNVFYGFRIGCDSHNGVSSGTFYITGIYITSDTPYQYQLPVNSDSSWLQPAEYSNMRGFMLNPNPTQQHFIDIGRTYNANIARFQINVWSTSDNPLLSDPTNMTSYDAWFNAKIATLDNACIWAQQNDIKLIVDMHYPPGGYDAQNQAMLEYNSTYYSKYIANWKFIATRYRNNPAVYAYDLLNEPSYPLTDAKPQSAESKNIFDVMFDAAEAVRAIDSVKPILVESVAYANHQWILNQEPFLSIPNIVYSVHFYKPDEYINSTTLQYPGFQLTNHSAYQISYIPSGTVTFTKDTLRTIMQPTREFQLRYKVPIFVGEFSATRWALGCAQYLQDVMDIFEEYGWGYCHHAFREANMWDVEYQAMPANQGGGVYQGPTTDRALTIINQFSRNSSLYTAQEQAPQSPQSVGFQQVSSTVGYVTWTHPTCVATLFTVEYKLHSDSVWTAVGTYTPTQGAQNSSTISGLVVGSSYDFRVTLLNVYGSKSATLTQTVVIKYALGNTSVPAARAFSIRKTISTYAGSCLKVRRSSDNTTQDIGFDSNGNLNTSALTAFIGSSDGYVDTWYDQIGSGHITMATQPNQPKIATAGIVSTDVANALPNLLFSANTNLQNTSPFMWAQPSTSVVGTLRASDQGTLAFMLAEGNSASNPPVYGICTGTATTQMGTYLRDDANATVLGMTGTLALFDGNIHQFEYTDTGTKTSLGKDGGLDVVATYPRAGHTLTLNNFSIGAWQRTALAYPWHGSIQEILIFNGVLSASDLNILHLNNQIQFNTP